MTSSKPASHSVAILGREDEPWADLPTGADLANWGRSDEISYNQMNRQTEKALFFRRTFDFLTDGRVNGDYMEFGCHRCRTFRMALTEARRHNQHEMKFWAFDSFEGLPELEHASSVEIWKKGALATPVEDFMAMVERHGIYVNNVHPVKGYYSDSLTPDLHKDFTAAGRKASLITVDCDLYESAVPVFKFVDDFIQEGTVIYMDDLFAGFKGSPLKGIARAFLEYQKKTKWRFIRHLDVGWWGRSYLAYAAGDTVDGVL